MKNSILILALIMAPLGAQTLSQSERDFAISNFHASRKMFLDSIAGLSEAQWKFKPAPDRWSIAECAEHIAQSEDMLYQLVTEKILKSEPAPREKPASREQDEALLKGVRDRSVKANAPEFLQPTGRWPVRKEIVAHFNESRDRSIDFVKTTQDDLRAHSTPHPKLGTLDAYQWLVLISGHTERHTAQIGEVKADPGFPKN